MVHFSTSGLLGEALISIGSCTAASGTSSQSSLSHPFHLKLRVSGGLQAFPFRVFPQERRGEAGRVSVLSKESDLKADDSVPEAYARHLGGLELSKEDDGAAKFDTVGNVMHVPTPAVAHCSGLRLDALDTEKDFRRRRIRPRLDVDTPIPKIHAKPGKRQNVPPKARKMILELRELHSKDFPSALTRFTLLKPDRAAWLYVLRFFKEKEDKSMLIQVFNFVLLEPAFKASARDYTNLMLVYVQLKNPEAAERTLKLMIEREIFPDLVTFTVLIGMHGNLGKFDMVNEKFSELKLRGLIPDTLVYCALIEAYSQLGHAKAAEMFLQDMELSDLPLKIEVFISLIRGYGNIGQVEEADRIFQLMQAKLFYPERRAYSALMDVYTKDGDLIHAIEVLNNMLSVGIEPTDKALARLLIACENKDMLQEATELVGKIESKCFKFGTKALISFKGWLQKLGLDTEVKQISLEVDRRLRRKAYLAQKLGTGAYLLDSSQAK